MRAGRAAAAEKQSMVSPESLTATSTTASTVSARPSGPSHCGSAPGTVSHVYGPSPRRASRTAHTAHHALSAAIPDPTASAATALLTDQLASTPRDLTTLLRLVRTLTLVGQILLYVQVNSVVVRLDSEDRIIERDLTTGIFSLDVIDAQFHLLFDCND